MDTTDNSKIDQEERRGFVRVQDAVGLHVHRLEDLPAAGQTLSPPLEVTVRKRDKYDIEGYAAVRRDHPAVGQYIDDLEERIRQLLLDGDEAPAMPSHKVSLSAGGIYFSDRILLHPGEMISLMLTLFPSGQRIGSDARIVSANDVPEVSTGDELNYRAVFVRMSDTDRQTIDEHVNKLLGTRPSMDD